MISAQFPEPFGTVVNTAKVCFHIYILSLVAISYSTLINTQTTYSASKDIFNLTWKGAGITQ